MKKEKELLNALVDLMRLAAEKGIVIEEISLMNFWKNEFEPTPDKLLGIKILK